MATSRGRNGSPLIERLQAQPQRFDLVQAVRILRTLRRMQMQGQPQRPGGQRAADDFVRFRAATTLGFGGSDVASVALQTKSAETKTPEGATQATPAARTPVRAEVVVNFMGLTGPGGALPYHYTAQLLRHWRQAAAQGQGNALRDFLDMLNHRLIALYAQAAERNQFAAGYERSRQGGGGGTGDVRTPLMSVVGLGAAALQNRMKVQDELAVYYGGHFGKRARSAASLEAVLRDAFGVEVRVEQFVGQWVTLGTGDRSAMPSRRNPRGLNNRLGSIVLGSRLWDVQGGLNVRIGPVDYKTYQKFLPGGASFGACVDIVRAFVGVERNFTVCPVLAAADVPKAQMGPDKASRPRMGRSTWMFKTSYNKDFDGARFPPDSRG